MKIRLAEKILYVTSIFGNWDSNYDKSTYCRIYTPEKCKYCCKPSFKYYDAIRFCYGYTKRTMLFKLNR